MVALYSETDDKKIDALALALSKSEMRDETTEGEAETFEWIQTHISHVFLVGDRVLKLRKAVAMPFLDFSSREARNQDCVREVALNRRLAPGVYLGIAPLVWKGKTVHLGTLSESITHPEHEHVVVMRRLPRGGDALTMLNADQLSANHLRLVAQRLSEFHASHSLGRPAPWSQSAWIDRIANPVLESMSALVTSKILRPPESASLPLMLSDRLRALRPDFERRRLQGKAVDAHGDLHLDHVWFDEDSRAPLVIDCLEFNEDLRRIDTASEVAFLAMDLNYRARPDLADAFLSAYALETDDYDLFSVVDFYQAYRALVRAKVACFATQQPMIETLQRDRARSSASKHAALAASLLESRESGDLVLLCGTVGSGKSTVARYLSDSGNGISISSDRVRKTISKVPLTTHTNAGVDEGLYRPEMTERAYAEMLDRAERIVTSGRTAILDASFSRRTLRDQARCWAKERGLTSRILEVRCANDVALDRLRTRSENGTDASDAGPDFLATSEERFQRPDEWPTHLHQIVWSG